MFKKYSTIIIFALVAICSLKSCQSCSRSRQIEYNKIEYQAKMDSMQSIISEQQHALIIAKDSINLLNTEIKSLQELAGLAMTSLQHQQQTNKTLVNHLKNQ